jgi:hypothetical protein
VSARDALLAYLRQAGLSTLRAEASIDAHRDEVALEIGRDVLRDGLAPTLIRLVGEVNAAKLTADFRDAFAHELAERIRAAYSGEGPDEDNWIRTPYDAADLIDPKAQRPAT